MQFQIRRAVDADRARILEIYAHARRFMREHGNPDQWKDSHPAVGLVDEDIALGRSLVCTADGVVQGVFVYLQGVDAEPDYRVIDGSWLRGGEYGVVHRIASSGEVRGAGSFMLEWAFSQCGHLRIDTHADNAVMQALLDKLGFSRRGVITLRESGEARIAFERV